MKPEVWQNDEQKSNLTDNEKIIFDALSKEKKMDLAELKNLSGLSNKQWDKSIKSLGKQGLTKVVKTDNSLTVQIL